MRSIRWPLAAAVASVAVVGALALGFTASDGRVFAALPTPVPDRPSDAELISALEDPGGLGSPDLLGIAQQLWARRSAMDRSQLTAVLLDPARPRVVRELMVDLLAGDPDRSLIADDMRSLLADESLDQEIRARIISQSRFGAADSGLLSSLAKQGEDRVAFFALKQLSAVDTRTAGAIARETIAAAGAASDERLSAAYKTLIRCGAVKDDAPTRIAFVAHLEDVLNDPDSSTALRTSATFALADVGRIEALRTLLQSPAADRALVAGAIDQNAAVIKAALHPDADEPTIALAVQAMEAHPLKDLAGPLEAVRKNVTSVELTRRLDAVMARIASEGVMSNPKWSQE